MCIQRLVHIFSVSYIIFSLSYIIILSISFVSSSPTCLQYLLHIFSISNISFNYLHCLPRGSSISHESSKPTTCTRRLSISTVFASSSHEFSYTISHEYSASSTSIQHRSRAFSIVHEYSASSTSIQHRLRVYSIVHVFPASHPLKTP